MPALGRVLASRRICSALLALGLGACAPRRQVWFTPSIGSPDMVELFTRPEAWPKARGRIDVFKFYAAQVLDDAVACPACGPSAAGSK